MGTPDNPVLPLTQVIGLASPTQIVGSELPTDFVQYRVVEALRELFAHHRGKFTWSDDEKKSGILIASVYALNLESVERKPAVIVRRGNVVWQHRFLGDFLESWGQASAPIRTDLRRASMVLHCVGRSTLQAECVANLVDSGLQYFWAEIIKAKGIIDFKMNGIGQVQLVRHDSDIDLATVPVSMEIHFQQKWMLRRSGAPALKEVRTTFAVDP